MANLSEREVAAWLLGFDRAMRGRVPRPMNKDRNGYKQAVRVAEQVMDLVEMLANVNDHLLK